MKQAADRGSQSQDLEIERYLVGRSKLTGFFQDRFGAVRRQFEADVEGTWDGQTLTLVEDFVYDDGETEQRTWYIQKVGSSGYQGRANGVIGLAEGGVQGNVLNWRYRFALPVGGRTWTVQFNDWLCLPNDEILINRAEVSKFGFRLGQVVCVFQRCAPEPESERTLASADAEV